jgi:hypothetical protein
MDAFQSVETASTQRTFWTVLGILSGLTYVIAGIGLFGAKASTQLRAERKDRSKTHGTRGTLQSRREEENFSEIRIVSLWFEKLKGVWIFEMFGMVSSSRPSTQEDFERV